MKFEKLDPKQMPKLIGLGVASVGLFGYVGWQMLGPGSQPPRPASAASPSTARSTATSTATAPPTGGDAELLAGPVRDDPFQPLLTPQGPVSAPVNVRPSTALPPARTHVVPAWPVEKPAPPRRVASVTPPPPPPDPATLRPQGLVVTGIIDGDPDLALVRLGENDRRIVRAGDVLPNQYRVVRIQMDGILLESPLEQWFVPVGPPRPTGVIARG